VQKDIGVADDRALRIKKVHAANAAANAI